MIVVHHLGVSQSERVVWLMEELGIDYKLVKHNREPLMSPESLKSLPGNKTGKAPFIEDSEAGITLSESGAICEYIVQRYGGGKLSLKPDDKHFSDYLYWLHWANASLMPAFGMAMLLDLLPDDPSNAMVKGLAKNRLDGALRLMDDRLKDNKWLAGDDFTVADVMTVYIPTTQRNFGPLVNLADYPYLLRWLKDCADRPGYQRAMEKGDPEMKILNQAEPPSVSLIAVGGITGGHWKK